MEDARGTEGRGRAAGADGPSQCLPDSGQPSAEAMAFAYVSGMHACKCCIGDDAESFCRKVGELVSETPRKGRRGKLNHVDVCIGNCKSSNCGKVEDEPIL